MIISGFTRIDTVTVPDWYMSVVRVSSEGEGLDPAEIRETLEKDKDSIDYVAISSDDDPLAFKDLYGTIKGFKPRGMKVLLITDGRDPAILDDLVGAGYVHAADLLVGESLTEEQLECIGILTYNGCKYTITVDAASHTEDSVSSIAAKADGCSMFIFRQDRKKPLSREEMKPLMKAAKACTWNIKTI